MLGMRCRRLRNDCMKNDELLLLLTAEFSVDLDSCLR